MKGFRSWQNDKGVTALEFAILAPIYFSLVLALVDLSFFFASRAIVEDAVENGSRHVRLGLLHSEDGEEQFRAALCSKIIFLECDRFQFSVEPSASALSTEDFNPAFDEDGNFTSRHYDPGGPEDLVVITISYKHAFIVPYVSRFFRDERLADPYSFMLLSYLVIKNEPYPE